MIGSGVQGNLRGIAPCWRTSLAGTSRRVSDRVYGRRATCAAARGCWRTWQLAVARVQPSCCPPRQRTARL